MDLAPDRFQECDVLAAAYAFLCRLEDKLDCAVQILAQRRQDLRSPESHCGVSVMSAGVHNAIVFRAKSVLRWKMFGRIAFQDRKRINIKTHGEHRTVTAVNHSDHTGHSVFCFGQESRIGTLRLSKIVVVFQNLG